MDRPGDLTSVGVVIVHYRREADVARLVHDLVNAHGIAPDRVVLVDNGSEPGRLGRELAGCEVAPTVVTLSNVGYAAAMNVGVRHLPESVDTLLLLTHEVVLAPGSIPALREVLAGEPGAGLVGPLLLRNPGEIWSAGGGLSPLRKLPAHRLHGAAVGSAPTEVTGCAWLDGAVLMTTRGLWQRVSGMDERYFLYLEDVDFGIRVARAGHRVLVAPQARAEQSPGSQIDPYLWTRNPFLLFRQNRMWAAWALWLVSVLAGMARDTVTMRLQGTQVPRRLSALRAGAVNHGGEPPRRVA